MAIRSDWTVRFSSVYARCFRGKRWGKGVWIWGRDRSAGADHFAASLNPTFPPPKCRRNNSTFQLPLVPCVTEIWLLPLVSGAQVKSSIMPPNHTGLSVQVREIESPIREEGRKGVSVVVAVPLREKRRLAEFPLVQWASDPIRN